MKKEEPLKMTPTQAQVARLKGAVESLAKLDPGKLEYLEVWMDELLEASTQDEILRSNMDRERAHFKAQQEDRSADVLFAHFQAHPDVDWTVKHHEEGGLLFESIHNKAVHLRIRLSETSEPEGDLLIEGFVYEAGTALDADPAHTAVAWTFEDTVSAILDAMACCDPA